MVIAAHSQRSGFVYNGDKSQSVISSSNLRGNAGLPSRVGSRRLSLRTFFAKVGSGRLHLFWPCCNAVVLKLFKNFDFAVPKDFFVSLTVFSF